MIHITGENKSWDLSRKPFGFGDPACPLIIYGYFHTFKASEMAKPYPAEAGD
ncbi:MAG: hypothetical protein JRJ65_09095 [Deltaproteobacteria bacterium]|nr:hypothetical protein [Deltaproteobacteria bacterium]